MEKEYKDLGKALMLREKLKNLRAIVVDDDVEVNNTFTEQLQRFFPKPGALTKYYDAETALSAIKEKNAVKPHVAFIDIKMPGMSGIELVDKLGKLKTPPLMVMFSASTEMENMSRAAEAGACAFINKSSGQLDALIRALEIIVSKKMMLKQQATIVLSMEVDERVAEFAERHNTTRSAVYQEAAVEFLKNRSQWGGGEEEAEYPGSDHS